MRHALLLMMVVAVGCSDWPEEVDRLKTHRAAQSIQVSVSPEVDSLWVESLAWAATEWGKALGKPISVRMRTKLPEVRLHDPQGDAARTYYDGSLWWIGVPETVLEERDLVMLHELGHWLGHRGHTDTGLMRETMATNPLCIDAAALQRFADAGFDVTPTCLPTE